MKTKLLFLVLGIAACAAAENLPVTARQNWPWDSRVIIDVTAPGPTNNLSITAEFDANGSHHALELSELNGLSATPAATVAGVNRFVWNPVAAGYTNVTSLSVCAETYSFNDRAWLVLDFTTGSHRYVALGDEPYTDGKPWNENVYMTKTPVFRRVPAGTYTVGFTDAEAAFVTGLSTGKAKSGIGTLSARQVTLTSDFYIMIYKCSEGLESTIRDPASTSTVTGNGGSKGSGGYVCYQRGYTYVREDAAGKTIPAVNWPATKFAVSKGSIVDKIRSRFRGQFMIDLPTLAQWQIAARPDAKWLWYEVPNYGGGTVNDDESTLGNVVKSLCQAFDQPESWSMPAVPGQYARSPYGLCDLVASRPELVLDVYDSDVLTATAAETDPVGRDWGDRVNWRFGVGGHAYYQTFADWAIPRVSRIAGDVDAYGNGEYAARYVIHLAPPQSFNGKWE